MTGASGPSIHGLPPAPISRRRQAAWTFVALCLLVAPCVRPLTRLVSPEAAVMTLLVGGRNAQGWGIHDRLDPWGEPWVSFSPPFPAPRRLFSTGPDRVSDGGAGDDIVFDDPLRLPPDSFRGYMLLHALPTLLAGLAAGMAWLLLAPWLRAPRARRSIEALRVAAGAAPIATLAISGAYWWWWEVEKEFPRGARGVGTEVLLVPLPVAGVLSLLAASLLLTVLVRVLRPKEVEAPLHERLRWAIWTRLLFGLLLLIPAVPTLFVSSLMAWFLGHEEGADSALPHALLASGALLALVVGVVLLVRANTLAREARAAVTNPAADAASGASPGLRVDGVATSTP